MSRLSSPLPSRELRRLYGEIYLIVAPPRTASTALARVFWQHPSIGFYCHEPYDAVYHRRASTAEAEAALASPLDIRVFRRDHRRARALIVKEMTFQVGEHFADLVGLTTASVVFLVCDPRLSIQSRRERRREGGQDPSFPLWETGWQALEQQIAFCEEARIPYLVLDSAAFRSRPRQALSELFERLDLRFSDQLLDWQPASEAALGGLGEEQSHWYRRVLSSRTIQPTTKKPLELECFPRDHGLRDHVRECSEIYDRILDNRHRIRVSEIALGPCLSPTKSS